MSIYKPTWLYIKKHNKTGLKYFGKTTQDPFKYKGSGVRWAHHLKIHGYDVSTVWTQLFEDEESLCKYAQEFSFKHNIVQSDNWANLIIENGKDGGARNMSSPETKEKLKKAKINYVPWNKGLTKNTDPRVAANGAKVSKSLKGYTQSEDHKMKISISNLGKSKLRKK